MKKSPTKSRYEAFSVTNIKEKGRLPSSPSDLVCLTCKTHVREYKMNICQHLCYCPECTQKLDSSQHKLRCPLCSRINLTVVSCRRNPHTTPDAVIPSRRLKQTTLMAFQRKKNPV